MDNKCGLLETQSLLPDILIYLQKTFGEMSSYLDFTQSNTVYDNRKETQSRGKADFHFDVNVKDTPFVDKNTDEEVVAFIDRHISRLVPDEDDDDTLRNLVLSR